jgi:hypothetical protein
MGVPPVEEGAVHVTVVLVNPADAVKVAGIPGDVKTITDAEGVDSGPLP